MKNTFDPGRDIVLHYGEYTPGIDCKRQYILGDATACNAITVPSRNDLAGRILAESGPQPGCVLMPIADKPTLMYCKELLESKHLQMKTVERFGKTWICQILDNVRPIADLPSIHQYRGKFAGRPAVVVSPGPSLSKNLAKLREANAVIIAGTHSLHALQAAGIRPDVTIVADPGHHPRHIEGIEPGFLKIVAAALTVRRYWFDTECEGMFTFAGNGQIDAWISSCFDEEWSVSTGGSVACSAMTIARIFGCNPITFVGQDLALGKDGEIYTAETEDGDLRMEKTPAGSLVRLRKGVLVSDHERMMKVPGYYGGMVVTTQSLAAFRTWFCTVAAEDKQTRYINATEGGAFIDGMDHIPFSEALKEMAEPFSPDFSVDVPPRRPAMRKMLKRMLRASTPAEYRTDKCQAAFAKHEDGPCQETANTITDAMNKLRPVMDTFALYPLYNHGRVVEIDERERHARNPGEQLQAWFLAAHLARRGVDFFGAYLRRAVADLSGDKS